MKAGSGPLDQTTAASFPFCVRKYVVYFFVKAEPRNFTVLADGSNGVFEVVGSEHRVGAELVGQLQHGEAGVLGLYFRRQGLPLILFFLAHKVREEGSFFCLGVAQVGVLELVNDEELFPFSLDAAHVNRDPLLLLVVEEIYLNVLETLEAVDVDVRQSGIEVYLVDDVQSLAFFF